MCVQADLSKVDRSVTPWVFLSLHRPVYSADASEYDSHRPGAPLATWLEPILQRHRVDLVVQGHVHCAERTQAQFNGTVVTAAVNEGPGAAANTYVVERLELVCACSSVCSMLCRRTFATCSVNFCILF